MKYLATLVCLLLFHIGYAQPLVIAHRGASGYLPEHTLEAVTLAHAQQADFIEQDLVLSRDLRLVVLHDIYLENVTNVEQMFPRRHRQDGRYYVFDFTLTELKTLRVHERQNNQGKQVYPSRYQGSGIFTIATFEEQIELIQQLNRQFNRNIGIYPEIKSPAWHKRQGADISQIVLNVLRKYDLDDPNKAVYLQCFDFSETKRLRNTFKAKVKLIQLIGENSWAQSKTDYKYLKSSEGLKAIAKVAQGIGPWIPQIFNTQTQESTGLTERAQQMGLKVHPYTFRQDSLHGKLSAEQTLKLLFKELKIDGIFTDFPDTVKTQLKYSYGLSE
jgi:glycerophosphoryl diester phosphodiesterase